MNRKERRARGKGKVTDQDLVSFVDFHAKQIKAAFSNKLLVTVICRHPTDPNATFFMSEDGIEAVKGLIDAQAARA